MHKKWVGLVRAVSRWVWWWWERSWFGLHVNWERWWCARVIAIWKRWCACGIVHFWGWRWAIMMLRNVCDLTQNCSGFNSTWSFFCLCFCQRLCRWTWLQPQWLDCFMLRFEALLIYQCWTSKLQSSSHCPSFFFTLLCEVANPCRCPSSVCASLGVATPVCQWLSPDIDGNCTSQRLLCLLQHSWGLPRCARHYTIDVPLVLRFQPFHCKFASSLYECTHLVSHSARFHTYVYEYAIINASILMHTHISTRGQTSTNRCGTHLMVIVISTVEVHGVDAL